MGITVNDMQTFVARARGCDRVQVVASGNFNICTAFDRLGQVVVVYRAPAYFDRSNSNFPRRTPEDVRGAIEAQLRCDEVQPKLGQPRAIPRVDW